MYIIAGLGNPGREYENTRHNIGFRCIDAIAGENDIDVLECKQKALIGKGYLDGEKVILVKPQTYMNLSGESIRAVTDYYKVDAGTNLIVIYDDISLSPGKIRIRKKGSAGGHNGIKSIIGQLGTDTFQRVKVGVGEKPAGYDLADYVLGHFNKEQEKLMQESIKQVTEAVKMMIHEDADAAMNHFN